MNAIFSPEEERKYPQIRLRGSYPVYPLLLFGEIWEGR